MNIETIDKEAQRYAQAREELHTLISSMKVEQDNVKRRHLPKIRRAVAKTKERRETLQTHVESSPEEFTRPKSRILHGIRVGYRKAKGKLTFPDPQQLVAKIKTEEKPVRAALNRLPAATLRKLGVEVTSDQDVAIVEPTDGEVDKIVTALLDDKDLEEAA